ncbi:MAG: hypothetical protein HY320_07470 [Armatimonadetes bacterium]|nr:hypothetical protein [Armatimonadota bacterium]
MARPLPTRGQRLTLIGVVQGLMATLLVVQLWLLVGTVEAVYAGDVAAAWPAALASGACFLVNLGILQAMLRAIGEAAPHVGPPRGPALGGGGRVQGVPPEGVSPPREIP